MAILCILFDHRWKAEMTYHQRGPDGWLPIWWHNRCRRCGQGKRH